MEEMGALFFEFKDTDLTQFLVTRILEASYVRKVWRSQYQRNQRGLGGQALFACARSAAVGGHPLPRRRTRRTVSFALEPGHIVTSSASDADATALGPLPRTSTMEDGSHGHAGFHPARDLVHGGRRQGHGGAQGRAVHGEDPVPQSSRSTARRSIRLLAVPASGRRRRTLTRCWRTRRPCFSQAGWQRGGLGSGARQQGLFCPSLTWTAFRASCP